MAFDFEPAFHDLGLRKGPVRGFTIHMAEGGGTVGFLSRDNRDGVSVHYVIERSGRTVQMLLESHMHSSIRIRNKDGSSAIRRTNDPNGFFGRSAAVVERVTSDRVWARGFEVLLGTRGLPTPGVPHDPAMLERRALRLASIG